MVGASRITQNNEVGALRLASDPVARNVIVRNFI